MQTLDGEAVVAMAPEAADLAAAEARQPFVPSAARAWADRASAARAWVDQESVPSADPAWVERESVPSADPAWVERESVP
jgi:hypothetical protein